MNALNQDQRVRERLAENAHDSWSRFMAYLFSKSESTPDGSVRIPKEQVARWRRQLDTPYDRLTFDEQESDRSEADRILAILKAEGNDGV